MDNSHIPPPATTHNELRRAKYQRLKSEQPEIYAELRKRARVESKAKYLAAMSDPLLGEANRLKHRAKVLDASRRRRDKAAVYMKVWRDENQWRQQSDNVGKRIARALRSGSAPDPVYPGLNYSMSNLMLWLEKKFERGMTWLNYGRGIGKWHIDHIKPVTSFDFTQPNALQECWSLSNLRPLWAVENLAQKPGRSLGLPLVPTPTAGDQLSLVPA